MSSLSDLMKSPDVGRPEREFPICVSGRLVKELEPLATELHEVESEIKRLEREQDSEFTPARRIGEASPLQELEQRADDLADQVEAVRERMKQHTVTLLLRSKTNGEWRRWASAHPARDDDADRTGAARDRRNAAGLCNIDALIADLGGYEEGGKQQPGFIAKYGDEDPTDQSWPFVLDNAAAGDLTRLASTVVGMHEQTVDLAGKSPRASRSNRRSATTSE